MSQAALKSRHKRVSHAVTIPQLAELLGVHRHKIYIYIQRGLIRAEKLTGGMVIMPDEANRVLDAATEVVSPKGTKTLFALDRI